MIFSILVNIECIVDFSESRAGKNQPQKRPRKNQVQGSEGVNSYCNQD
jgi:hypothetical protein